MNEESDVQILKGSSEEAGRLVPDLVEKCALVVTSPPYHNAISYSAHQEDRSSDHRKREGLDYAGDYLPMLDKVWSECWNLLRPGGHLVINAGTVLEDGYQFALPQDIEGRLTSGVESWSYITTIFWNKVTAGVKRAGSVIQHRLPGYWHPNIMTEHVLVFRKPGARPILNRDVPGEWWECVWDLAPVPPRTVDHPAPFPEDLPHRFIRMLTNPKDYVIDPFNGSGATTKAAKDLGRNAVGFDISEQYIEIAKQRLKADSSVRTQQILVHPVPQDKFVPGKSRGRTRHGAGLMRRAS